MSSITIECKCSTKECRQERTESCTAKYACYVEIHVDDNGKQTGSVLRGCIDTKASLLCENRRPENIRINKPWPYLYCCEQDFCNQQVLPTLPTNNKITVSSPASGRPSTVYPMSHLQAVSRPNTRSVNPMYIAIPLVGVCILLALIVFALYLLRQRTEYNSFQSPASGVSNPSSTNDHFDVNGIHRGKHSVMDLPSRNSKSQPAVNTTESNSGCATSAAATAASAVAAVAAEAATSGSSLSKSVCNNRDLISHCSESDRSSSGSETKLFLQV
ncbi:Hypothetical predicted protein [Octopus vulgaris]|uniref:Activin types I and II receptor domain-containing protein n=1 Tax=Octopus vulgaris TaxID=6645 RepID=A0AA36B4E0_OCTVU|nr:Hypothetical predicted protein [Octopus vulgaris]